MTPLTGPIAIVGAHGHVGRQLWRRLEDLPVEARSLGRQANVEVGLADAGSVVHLAGALHPRAGDTYEDANLVTVLRTIAAAGPTVQKIVFVSYVGANPADTNAYRRAKGQAEQALRDSGKPFSILRCSYVYGAPDDPGPSVLPFLARDDRPVSVLGDGRQRIAPVFVEDVVDAILRTLDPSVPSVTLDLVGPETMTLDRFIEIVNHGLVPERHLGPHASHLLAHLAPALTPTLAEVLLSDSLATGTLAADVLDLELRTLEDVYGLKLAAV